MPQTTISDLSEEIGIDIWTIQAALEGNGSETHWVDHRDLKGRLFSSADHLVAKLAGVVGKKRVTRYSALEFRKSQIWLDEGTMVVDVKPYTPSVPRAYGNGR